MSLYRRGEYWWVSMWKGGTHVQVSTKLKEKRKARAVEQALRIAGVAENGLGERITDGSGDGKGENREIVLGLLRAVYGDGEDETSLGAVWDEYKDVLKVKGKVVTPKNLRDKKSCLESFIEWSEKQKVEYVGQVDGALAKKYAINLSKKDMSAKRRKNIIQHLSAVWNAIAPNHRGMVNPWPMVSPSNVEAEERLIFTVEQEREVFRACKEVHPQWFVASMIARNTGLRYGDVCRLTYDKIDLEGGKIHNVCPHKTKDTSGAVVTVPISKTLKPVLVDWFNQNPRRQPNDRVLPWLREYGPKDNRRFSTVLAKVGLDPKKYSFHTWRHCFRSALTKAGATTEMAMKLCGHTTKEMSARYDHTEMPPQMREIVDRASEG